MCIFRHIQLIFIQNPNGFTPILVPSSIMAKPFFLFLLPLLIILTIFIQPSSSSSSSNSSSCPFDLSYVQTFPWDTSTCSNSSTNATHCCQTLLSLFGMGLAQHLRDTNVFELPNVNSSTSCLSDFGSKLESLSINRSLVPYCFHNATQFVANSSSCAGIKTTQDFKSKVLSIDIYVSWSIINNFFKKNNDLL